MDPGPLMEMRLRSQEQGLAQRRRMEQSRWIGKNFTEYRHTSCEKLTHRERNKNKRINKVQRNSQRNLFYDAGMSQSVRCSEVSEQVPHLTEGMIRQTRSG